MAKRLDQHPDLQLWAGEWAEARRCPAHPNHAQAGLCMR